MRAWCNSSICFRDSFAMDCACSNVIFASVVSAFFGSPTSVESEPQKPHERCRSSLSAPADAWIPHAGRVLQARSTFESSRSFCPVQGSQPTCSHGRSTPPLQNPARSLILPRPCRALSPPEPRFAHSLHSLSWHYPFFPSPAREPPSPSRHPYRRWRSSSRTPRSPPNGRRQAERRRGLRPRPAGRDPPRRSAPRGAGGHRLTRRQRLPAMGVSPRSDGGLLHAQRPPFHPPSRAVIHLHA